MIIDAHTCWHTYEMKGIRLSEKEFVSALDRFGIDKAMVCTPFFLLTDYVLGNDRTLKLMKKYPDRILGFATLNPLFEKETISELERCVREGMKGIKLHCDLSQVPYDNPLTFPVVEKAVEFDIPLFLHTGEDSISQTQYLARKYPEATFILAHIGNTAWHQMCDFARDQKNVVLCLSGGIFERDFLRKAVAEAGDDRVVFGSDFVFINPAANLGIVNSSGLSRKSKEKILGENIRRILKL
jgi:predicted TIM-barrel fold metal-dependent hydrolase